MVLPFLQLITLSFISWEGRQEQSKEQASHLCDQGKPGASILSWDQVI